MGEEEQQKEADVQEIPPVKDPVSERPQMPVYKLTEIERVNLDENFRELSQLANNNVNLDLQKRAILDEIDNKIKDQERMKLKIIRRLGLPDNLRFDIDTVTGIMTPAFGPVRVVRPPSK